MSSLIFMHANMRKPSTGKARAYNTELLEGCRPFAGNGEGHIPVRRSIYWYRWLIQSTYQSIEWPLMPPCMCLSTAKRWMCGKGHSKHDTERNLGKYQQIRERDSNQTIRWWHSNPPCLITFHCCVWSSTYKKHKLPLSTFFVTYFETGLALLSQNSF